MFVSTRYLIENGDPIESPKFFFQDRACVKDLMFLKFRIDLF